MREISLVIFDCDGVLVDSELIAARESALLKTELGFPISTEENVRRFIGLGQKDVARLEGRDRFPPDYTERMHERRNAAFRAELREIEGISELLRTLPVPYCVASSGYPAKINLTLGITGLAPLFAGKIFHADMVEHAKPAPDLFLLAARTMGFPPRECLVIEDSVAGVRAAVAAGMPVLGFTGGSHVYPELAAGLREAGAWGLFSEMRELPAAMRAAGLGFKA